MPGPQKCLAQSTKMPPHLPLQKRIGQVSGAQVVPSLNVFNARGTSLPGNKNSPKVDGGKLTFDVDVLEGDFDGADGPGAVVIDIIGRPRTPPVLWRRRAAYHAARGLLRRGGGGRCFGGRLLRSLLPDAAVWLLSLSTVLLI
jgi:hypothetical protein